MKDKRISSDGSDRTFTRIRWKGIPAIEIDPCPGPAGLAEARAFYFIGSHLYKKGVPVPRIYSFNEDNGILIVEDLGNSSLYSKAVELVSRKDLSSVTDLYQHVMKTLLHMQFQGAEGFDIKWCWQGPYYDYDLVVEKEIGYFLKAFLTDYAGIEYQPEVKKELLVIAENISQFKPKYFLHRDFQSRNILLHNGRARIIDFQAARLGPLGYDLASLLFDPYVELPEEVREACLAWYLKELNIMGLSKEAEEIRRSFLLLASCRILQALGAYGFLVKRKRRNFFRSFIRPGVSILMGLLGSLERERGFSFTCTLTLLDLLLKRKLGEVE